MRRLLLLGGVLACTMPQPPQPVAPVAFHSERTASEVAQIAAQQLALAGFTLTQSDANGGIVTAHRDRAKLGNGEYVNCKYGDGSSGANLMDTDLTVSVIAKPAANGSDVQIVGAVRTTYPGMAGTGLEGAMPPSDTDCASNGVLEKRIADAIR